MTAGCLRELIGSSLQPEVYRLAPPTSCVFSSLCVRQTGSTSVCVLNKTFKTLCCCCWWSGDVKKGVSWIHSARVPCSGRNYRFDLIDCSVLASAASVDQQLHWVMVKKMCLMRSQRHLTTQMFLRPLDVSEISRKTRKHDNYLRCRSMMPSNITTCILFT